VLDCLCEHFSAIGREQWLDRIACGRVLDGQGVPITVDLPYREGLRIHYFTRNTGRKNDPGGRVDFVRG
jgi:tRNA pseudouridine32 synthase/23S rRNA pseudouridine746 synthase